MSIKKKHNGLRYLLLAVLLLAGVFSIGWFMNQDVRILSIDVEGNRFTETDHVLLRSGIQSGISVDSISFLSAIEHIEELPWIERAYVMVSPTGRATIRIEEEQPLVLLIDNGRNALVTENGLVLPSILEHRIDVPILYGFPISRVPDRLSKPDTLNSKAFHAIKAFLNTAEDYPGLYALISEVMYTERDGVVTLTDENAVRLTFGHDGFDKKIHNWHTFQSRVVSGTGMNQFWSLDFRFRGQIVARER